MITNLQLPAENGHVVVAVDPYDGGVTQCKGCGAFGTFTESPKGVCPSPYVPYCKLLEEALGREAAMKADIAALRALGNDPTGPRSHQAEHLRHRLVRIAEIGRELSDFDLDADEVMAFGKELQRLSGICGNCHGNGATPCEETNWQHCGTCNGSGQIAVPDMDEEAVL